MALHIVTDFDGTLMHQDVGDTIMHELGVYRNENAREGLRLYKEKKIGSRDLIPVIFSYLEDKKKQVDEVIEGIHPREGALPFLDFCRENDFPVTILSDGMGYYIDQITAKFNIHVDKIVSNPITYHENGEYLLDMQNDNPACSWCGCCKAGVVRRLKQEGHSVVYIGDGSSDLYGSGFADWVFARSSLAAHLERAGESYFPYESFHDVLRVLKPQIEAFRSGTAGGKRKNENTFCKFA